MALRQRKLLVSRLCRLQEILTAGLSNFSTELKLSTDNALLDEKVEISVQGLSKGQKVTLHTHLTDRGSTFGACGHYVADDHGQVSTFAQPSLGGSYTGVEGMGLFWTVASEPGGQGKRLQKEDITTPFDVTVSVQEGFIDPPNLPWTGDFSQVLHKKLLKRHYMAPGVKRFLVEEDGVFGALILPPGTGPFPTVIDIHGFSGGILDHRAAVLASKGIASFTLAYINYKTLPKDGTDLDFGYFLRAFDWLCSHPAVNSDAMGSVCSCVGGAYSMFIASRRPKIRCMVNINGTAYPAGLSQVVEGEEVHATMFDPNKAVIEDGAALFNEMSLSEEHMPVCPAWQHGAKILFLTGNQDKCVDFKIKDRIRAWVPVEFEKNMTYVLYPGAGHLLETPYGPLCRVSYMKIVGMSLLWGGVPKPHADAQEDSWKRLVDFLQDNLMGGRS